MPVHLEFYVPSTFQENRMLLVFQLFGYHVVSSDPLFLCYRNSQRPFRSVLNFKGHNEVQLGFHVAEEDINTNFF
ncbi:uncharacterized protein LOC120257507 isoform X2 [Dioscorea cayenensis subsp. rotundata]|uniref:Uncharacterized protein LOC120257507 isoform X2 n=1 Tax=Dioscorea cayennensis subsp. rotundata TaxID=55577 RepID=A0AB40B0X0_DIOCR|nr:uncharacterized protein LOC120257507 isoform X2 [Dioscorea cayenensis subsp. rotundata]